MGNSLRVIVVDDQVDLAETTGKLLRLYGHQVSVFDSAPCRSECTATSESRSHFFRHRHVPGMDGCELAARIKTRPDCQRIILAALTGLGDEEYRQAAISAGFDYRFVKPMQPDELQHFVEEIARTRGSSLILAQEMHGDANPSRGTLGQESLGQGSLESGGGGRLPEEIFDHLKENDDVIQTARESGCTVVRRGPCIRAIGK